MVLHAYAQAPNYIKQAVFVNLVKTEFASIQFFFKCYQKPQFFYCIGVDQIIKSDRIFLLYFTYNIRTFLLK